MSRRNDEGPMTREERAMSAKSMLSLARRQSLEAELLAQQKDAKRRAENRKQWSEDYCTNGCTVCMQKRGVWSHYGGCGHMFCPPCMRANKVKKDGRWVGGRCPVCRWEPPNGGFVGGFTREYCLTKEQRVALDEMQSAIRGKKLDVLKKLIQARQQEPHSDWERMRDSFHSLAEGDLLWGDQYMEMPLLIVAAFCNRHPIVRVRYVGTVSYLSVIRVLIDNGVDINATDGDGTTALAWAIMRRDYELCEYLLSNNAHATPEQQNIIQTAKEGRGGIWWLSERREMGYPLSEKRKRENDIVSRAVRRTRKRDYDKRQL